MIVCGMSGGVDSSVAAALLQRDGHDVRGVFMRNWDEGDPGCRAQADRMDAMRVCGQLEIACRVLDFQAEYRDQVFAAFLDGYARGITPNPDILCNREIKFGVFLDRMLSEGVETLATGHYARLATASDGNRLLLRARDHNKDQSYFLSGISQAALRHACFPLGDLPKPRVRAIAADLGLVTATKKDSTGICFIGKRDFRQFLASYLPAQAGPIVDLTGRQIGQHAGALYYTVGQRAPVGGIKGAPEGPWFISHKRVVDNTLVAVPGASHPALMSSRARVLPPNWIAGHPPSDDFIAAVQLHHRGALHPARVRVMGDGGVSLEFDEPVRAIAAGQQAVFYQDEVCLGGGEVATDPGR